jgi:hypothetical protein
VVTKPVQATGTPDAAGVETEKDSVATFKVGITGPFEGSIDGKAAKELLFIPPQPNLGDWFASESGLGEMVRLTQRLARRHIDARKSEVEEGRWAEIERKHRLKLPLLERGGLRKTLPAGA